MTDKIEHDDNNVSSSSSSSIGRINTAITEATTNTNNNNNVNTANDDDSEIAESIRSYDSYNNINNLQSHNLTDGVNKNNTNPNEYIPNTLYDTYSRDSEGKLEKVETETAETLRKRLSRKVTLPNTINYPEVGNNYTPIFPENYTLETRTGLVPLQSLHNIGRSTTNASLGGESAESQFGMGSGVLKRTETIPLTLQESKVVLNQDIEFVTFKLQDPENPLNWKLKNKILYTLLITFSVITTAYGSACVSGALGTVTEKYHVSSVVATLSVSTMVGAFAISGLIFSPISDLYGRRISYSIALGLYTIFNIPCALSPNLAGHLICRAICGVTAGATLSQAGASLSDMFAIESRGYAIACFSICPYGGAVLGVLVNGFVGTYTKSMNWIIWVNMMLAGFTWFCLTFIVPETFAPYILKKRAARLRKELQNENIMTEQEAVGLSFKEMLLSCLVRPIYFILTEPVLNMMCFYVCLIYTLLYCFFFAYPIIFGELFDYGDDVIGMMFIPILVGALLSVLCTIYCEREYMKLVKDPNHVLTPEDRLLGAKIGAPATAISLWVLGATSSKHVYHHWALVSIIPGTLFGFGMVLVYYSVNNYIIDCYAQYASAALTSKVFERSFLAAGIILLIPAMFHKLGLMWACFVLAFVSTFMIALPFTFSKWGASFRKRLSKKDYTEAALNKAE
ncbi:hypothetical protein ACO0SA_000787 [Hanseniaspora valbyensis]